MMSRSGVAGAFVAALAVACAGPRLAEPAVGPSLPEPPALAVAPVAPVAETPAEADPPSVEPPAPPAAPDRAAAAESSGRDAVAGIARSMIGTPYRYGGTSPRGFDCSGLVVYSYARAGHPGIPRSAAGLEDHTRSILLAELQPGDLLFFDLDGKKTSHVAIYVGDRAFVHAPSRGKRVEEVRFDHVYWGPRLARAGRLELSGSTSGPSPRKGP